MPVSRRSYMDRRAPDCTASKNGSTRSPWSPAATPLSPSLVTGADELKSFVGVLLSFWISLMMVWLSEGSSLTSREFWAGGWFFGLPLLLLAPLYLAILARLPQRTWVLSAIGLALFPLPLALFFFAMGSMQDGSLG